MKIEMYFDSFRHPMAKSDDEWGLLGSFLYHEVQGDELVEYWISQLYNVEGDWLNGNSHSIKLFDEYIYIVNDYMSSVANLKVNLQDFIDILKKWSEFTSLELGASYFMYI